MVDYPTQLNPVADECEAAPTSECEPQRPRPRWRIALCGIAIAMLFGTGALFVTANDDRNDAVHGRDRARDALVAQRARTRSAEERLNAAGVAVRSLSAKIPTPLATTQNLGTIDAAALDAIQQLQRIGLGGDPDAYNATIDRLDVLTDEYNATLDILEQQVKALGLDDQPTSTA